MRTLALGLLLATALPAQVPSPKDVFGHDVGEDYFLANYTQLQEYWYAVAAASDRVAIEEIGSTSYGQDHIMAVITSPANHARLDELRKGAETLARARIGEEEARTLARDGVSVVWIDGGLHATETVAGQNILELVHRMSTGDSDEVKQILDNVVLLVVPANPDGMEMIANAYMATQRISLPVLYQRYVGHDNNRDFYAVNQQEAWNINRILYERWYPQIVYNHHQSAPRGTVIFTPPFRDPFNYNYDPLVVRGIDLVSAHMNHRFTLEQKPGVISETGASYSTWWNGGLRTTVYFHNMIGILTEVFGSPTPTRITQRLSQRLPYGDYPDPIGSQEWHAAQTIEYLQTANFGILTYAARYREELAYGIYQMGRNSIERGSRDHWTITPTMVELAEATQQSSAEGDAAANVFRDPELRDARAYVLSADQPDGGALARFVRCLLKTGVEVHEATAAFEVGGVSYPEKSVVVFTAQAFRPHVLDMFEPQDHPDDVAATGEPIRPYDSAGWTLAFQMGVEFDRILEPFEGPLERMSWMHSPRGKLRGAGTKPQGYVIDHRDSNAFAAVNRLMSEGRDVHWFTEACGGDGWEARVGDVFVPQAADLHEFMRQLAFEESVDIVAVSEKPEASSMALRPVRIGLYDQWGGNMPTGWAEWALEDFEFPVEIVFADRIERGKLYQDYDVLLFFTGLPGGRDLRSARGRRPIDEEVIAKLQEALPEFEDWSTLPSRATSLGSDAWKPLREFVEAGGTLVAVGSQTSRAIRGLELPVKVGPLEVPEDGGEARAVSREKFFIPGSIVALDVDHTHPLGYGVRTQVHAMFRRSPVFEVQDVEGEGPEVAVVARYASTELLRSGWAIGEEYAEGEPAILEVSLGRGRVALFGPDVMYRGQPVGTFKFVFNAIQAAARR